MPPVWVLRSAVFAIHDEQLAQHGGAEGIRDEGLLESALCRPENLLAYGHPDTMQLAAAYAIGIVRNHPFVDGNKRTSLATSELFLALNGYELIADDAACVAMWISLADGSSDEEIFVEWLRRYSRPS